MADIGWKPSGRHFLWAAASGVVASVIIGIPMMQMGALENMVAALVGSDSLVVGWIVHLLAGAVFGGLFGLFLSTRSVWKGIGFGLLYGLIVGVLFAWLAVFAILGLPLTLADPRAQNDLMLHLLWGAILGGLYAFALKQTEPRESVQRRGARVW